MYIVNKVFNSVVSLLKIVINSCVFHLISIYHLNAILNNRIKQDVVYVSSKLFGVWRCRVTFLVDYVFLVCCVLNSIDGVLNTWYRLWLWAWYNIFQPNSRLSCLLLTSIRASPLPGFRETLGSEGAEAQRSKSCKEVRLNELLSIVSNKNVYDTKVPTYIYENSGGVSRFTYETKPWYVDKRCRIRIDERVSFGNQVWRSLIIHQNLKNKEFFLKIISIRLADVVYLLAHQLINKLETI